MSTAHATLPGGGPPTAAGELPEVAGRIEVRDRVVRRVSEQAAAQIIGVAVEKVSATVVDHRGGVAVRVHAPMPVPPLDDADAVRAAGAVVETAQRMQRLLQDRLSTVLGRPVTRVDITITGAVAPTKRRVR